MPDLIGLFMCCDDDYVPPHLAEMLARYGEMLTEHGFDWGQEFDATQRILIQHIGRFAPDQALSSGQTKEAIDTPLRFLQKFIPDDLPLDVAVVSPAGIRLPNPLPHVLPGRSVSYHLFHLNAEGALVEVSEAEVSADDPVLHAGGHRVTAAGVATTGRVRLTSDDVSRWSVVDDRSGSWFPEGALRKFAWRGLPFFHADDVVLDLPVGPATVTVARGCEFRPVTVSVDVRAEEEAAVHVPLERLYDAASSGWYGGDLHVHMNYYGDDVATPKDAATMQRGEGLHLMNLVAGNLLTSLVYDREAFETYIGQDLPWSHSHSIARWGVEYRNDFFGHFHALDPSASPTHFHSGHEHSDHPHDWPPNAVAAQEFRDLGATIGYTHPVFQPMAEDGSPEPVFSEDKIIRSNEARELVADAPLGLVDSIDMGGAGNISGTEYLYHRLLGCGLHLAASAGTDTMLQNARVWPLSNPPGWFRSYADVGDATFTVQSWQNALKAGKTFVTNGPWLELTINGHGLGESIELEESGQLRIHARSTGLGVEELEIVGPDGTIAARAAAPGTEEIDLDIVVDIDQPLWIAAIARGPEHPAVPGPEVYAHTSPIWINVNSTSVARASDAEWCLDWLERFEVMAREHAHFDADHHLNDFLAVLDEARLFYRRITQATAAVG